MSKGAKTHISLVRLLLEVSGAEIEHLGLPVRISKFGGGDQAETDTRSFVPVSKLVEPLYRRIGKEFGRLQYSNGGLRGGREWAEDAGEGRHAEQEGFKPFEHLVML